MRNKGQMFLIASVIIMIILIMLKVSTSLPDIIQEKRKSEGNFIRELFVNMVNELPKVIEISYHQQKNITNNVFDFGNFTRKVMNERLMDFEFLYVGSITNNSQSKMDVTVINLLNEQIDVTLSLNTTIPQTSSQNNISDSSSWNTNFAITPGDDYILTVDCITSNATQQLTTLNDGSSEKNITFSGAGSDMSYGLKIDKDADVTSAKMNLTGYEYLGYYPTSPTLDIGNDGDNEWYYTTGSPAWWNASWFYRKAHNISGSSEGNQTNYQMKFIVINGSGSDSGDTVYIDNKARSDFGDIRFINSTDDELDYWNKTVNNGENATFWVELPFISNVTNNTVYIYYGNSGATSTSTEFRENLTTYSETDPNNHISLTDDYQVNHECYELETAYLIKDFGANYFTGHMVHFDGQIGTGNNAVGGGVAFGNEVGARVTDWDNANYVTLYERLAQHRVYLFYEHTGVLTFNWDENVMGEGTWHYFDFYFNSTNSTLKMYSDDDRTNLLSTYVVARSDDDAYRYFYGTYSPNSGQASDWVWYYFANIHIRKYVYPEPSHGDWGSEETNTFNTTETVQDFSSELDSFLPDCSCSGCVSENQDCTIPLKLSSYSSGIIKISNIDITLTFSPLAILENITIVTNPEKDVYVGFFDITLLNSETTYKDKFQKSYTLP